MWKRTKSSKEMGIQMMKIMIWMNLGQGGSALYVCVSNIDPSTIITLFSIWELQSFFWSFVFYTWKQCLV